MLKTMIQANCVLIALIAFTGVAFAGTLEPPDSAIDSNTGDPKPTMKSLDSIPGSWDRLLPANDGPDPCQSSRFTCVLPTTNLFLGAAVRDNETGLVWDRVPLLDTKDWKESQGLCWVHFQANRHGWRLAYLEEILSLFDSLLRIPDNHPFLLQSGGTFWTATTSHIKDDEAYAINPENLSETSFLTFSKSESHRRWCVRGPVSGTP